MEDTEQKKYKEGFLFVVLLLLIFAIMIYAWNLENNYNEAMVQLNNMTKTMAGCVCGLT